MEYDRGSISCSKVPFLPHGHFLLYSYPGNRPEVMKCLLEEGIRVFVCAQAEVQSHPDVCSINFGGPFLLLSDFRQMECRVFAQPPVSPLFRFLSYPETPVVACTSSRPMPAPQKVCRPATCGSRTLTMFETFWYIVEKILRALSSCTSPSSTMVVGNSLSSPLFAVVHSLMKSPCLDTD